MEELRARLFWDIPPQPQNPHFLPATASARSLGFCILPLIALQSLMVPKAPATKAVVTWLWTRPICLNRGFRESSSQATCWLALSWGHHLQNCSTNRDATELQGCLHTAPGACVLFSHLHNCSISPDATELRGCLHRVPGAVCAVFPQLWRLKSKNTAWAGWVCPGKPLPGLQDDHLLVLSLCGSVHEFPTFPVFS